MSTNKIRVMLGIVILALLGLIGSISANIFANEVGPLLPTWMKPNIVWWTAAICLVTIVVSIAIAAKTQMTQHPDTDSLAVAIANAIKQAVGSSKSEQSSPLEDTSSANLLNWARGTYPISETTLKELGIVGTTEKLSQSKFEPIECMKLARRSISFMGIVGSKWVSEGVVLDEFKRFLQRVQGRGGHVKFLMINPNGDGFAQLKDFRQGAIKADSLKCFKALEKQFSCLEVRLYSHLPCFRLVFIDNELVAVSRYKYNKEGYFQSKYGWEAPHLVIESKSCWSFYDPFEAYFHQSWTNAKPLSDFFAKKRKNTLGNEV